jgi:hypothetical protein
MKKIKLEIVVEVEDDFLENNEEEDLLNFCGNILELGFEEDPTGDPKKLILEESRVIQEENSSKLSLEDIKKFYNFALESIKEDITYEEDEDEKSLSEYVLQNISFDTVHICLMHYHHPGYRATRIVFEWKDKYTESERIGNNYDGFYRVYFRDEEDHAVYVKLFSEPKDIFDNEVLEFFGDRFTQAQSNDH